MVLQLTQPTTQLDSVGSFAKGVSIADAIAARRQEQQKLSLVQEELAFKQMQDQRKIQQEQAKQELAVQAFNNPEAFKQVYARDPELGAAIAQQRDRYNQVTSSIVGDILNTPVEERQKAWDRSKNILQQRGFDTNDLPKQYSPEVDKLLALKQKELQTWDSTFKTIATDRGLELFDEKTGTFRETGRDTLANQKDRLSMDKTRLDMKKTQAEISKIYNDITQNKLKLDKEKTTLTEKEKGAEQVSYIGERMKELYGKLDEAGGIINPDKGTFHNLLARARSGEWTGQVVGKAIGTQEQSYRREIDNLRNQAKLAIMQATGMSSKSIDSNQEAKSLLDSLGSPNQDVRSSLSAVEAFVDRYGKKGYESKSTEESDNKKLQMSPIPANRQSLKDIFG